MLDLPLILASFMGDAQTSKRKKKNNKNTVKTKQLSDVFSDTRWRYRFHWVSYRGAWILARVICKGFQRFHTTEDVRPPTHFSYFYGRYTTKKKKKKKKTVKTKQLGDEESRRPGDSTGSVTEGHV